MFDLTLYLCMLLTVFDIRAQIWRRSFSSFIICTGPFIPSRSFFRVFLIRWSWLTSISSTTFASWLGSINNFTSSLCHFQISRSILCRHHLRPAIFQICPNRMGYLWWSVSKQGRVIFEFEIIELKKYLYSKKRIHKSYLKYEVFISVYFNKNSFTKVFWRGKTQSNKKYLSASWLPSLGIFFWNVTIMHFFPRVHVD